MIVKKRSGSYDVYNCELSYAELMALQAAGQGSGDPIADEAAKAIQWYFAHEVAPPGLDEHPAKAAKEANPEADQLLAAPEGGDEQLVPGAGTPPGGGVPIAPSADDLDPVQGADPDAGAGAGAPDEEAEIKTEVSLDDEAEELLSQE